MKVKITASLKVLSTLVLSATVLSSMLAVPAFAQSEYRGGNYGYQSSESDYISIYKDCNFRGERRDVLVGEFKNMRSVNFGNDSVSSVKVPRGMELLMYEDDNFRGASARVSQDISCFDRQWNDKVSSLIVSGRVDNRRNNERAYNDNRRDYSGRNDGRNYNDQGRNNYNRNGASNNSNVSAKNLSQVVFDGAVLQQTNKKQWQMNSARSGVTQYKELRRDRDSVYLQNNYSSEKVRIDLFANDVTIINRQGRQQRYAIQDKQAALGSGINRSAVQRDNKPNRRITNQCFNYRAYSRGGDASVRFQTRESLKRFNNSTVTGRICHNGSLNMEIGKRNANTNVVVEIDGQTFRFAPNEQETSYLNNWFRKTVTLKVGR